MSIPAVPEWTLGWRLQRALAYANIPVDAMAKALGVSRSTVSRWMNDRGAEPRHIYLSRWAEWCGVSASWLTTGQMDPAEELDPSRPPALAGVRKRSIRSRLADLHIHRVAA